MNKRELESAKILIGLAIHEDVGPGDITTDSLVPSGMKKHACMVAKAGGVIAGLEVAEMVFRRFDPDLVWKPLVNDGKLLPPMSMLPYLKDFTQRFLTPGKRFPDSGYSTNTR